MSQFRKIFVNLTCINQTPVYSEHNSWSQGGSVQTGFIVVVKLRMDIILMDAPPPPPPPSHTLTVISLYLLEIIRVTLENTGLFDRNALKNLITQITFHIFNGYMTPSQIIRCEHNCHRFNGIASAITPPPFFKDYYQDVLTIPYFR